MVVVGCRIGCEVTSGIFHQVTNVEFEMFSHVAQETRGLW